MSASLAERVCVVAGGSRGVGRGIARALGEAGATVVVTGRSTESGARTDGRRESIEDTARLVEEAGGRGHPYRCDHTIEREVDGLAAWVLRRFGRADVVANAVWGGNEGYDGKTYADGSAYGTPFWRRPASQFVTFIETGAYAQLITARAFAPGMVGRGSGLFVSVTFADDAWLGDIFYDLAKAAMCRLAFGMAAELAPHGVTSVALSPGFVRTERVVEAGLTDEATESPLYAGRAAAALAADPGVARWNGRALHAGDLADVYGFTDEDGTRPRRFVVPVSQGGPDHVAQG